MEEPVAELGAANTKQRDTKYKVFANYEAAIRESQLSNRPLLAVLGAKWCSWCRKLEGELETSEAAAALSNWVIVKIDVDEEPEIAQKLEAAALPALRILGPWQTVVASQEGYLELAELQNWLANNRAAADPAKFAILFDTAEPDDATIQKLVAILAEASPMARSAAVERLAAHPRAVAPAIVQTLKTGRLLQQLCACDILRRWHAPVGGIDPWQPESLQSDDFGQLVDWSRKLLESGGNLETIAIGGDGGELGAGPEIDQQSVNDLLLRLMKAEANERATIIAQLLGAGPSLAGDVRTRLAQATVIDDHAREGLRELLYNLLASRKLRLQQAGMLAALARLDLESHRQAAETLLEKAEVIDQPLVDELIRDSDPLVRELAIRALGRLQLLTTGDRVGRLLGDTDPNVRAAVLRVLAERPSAESVDSLSDYLLRETNEDLLVHGAKCLGQLGGHRKAMSALAELAGNKSWRVRAAAIDAVVQALQKASGNSITEFGPVEQPSSFKVTPEVANAIVAAAFEKDNFVAERAAKALPAIIQGEIVDPKTLDAIAQTLADHPNELQRIVNAAQGNPRVTGGVDRSQQTFAPLIKPAQEWLKQNDAKQLQRAAVLLGRFAPTELNDRMGVLIGSSDPAVRATALRAALHSLEDYRKSSIESAAAAWATRQRSAASERDKITPWYDVPRANDDETKPLEKSQPASAESPPPIDGSKPMLAPAEARGDPKPRPVNSSIDLLKDLFGAVPENAPASANDEARQAASDDELDRAIPSVWMKNWQGPESNRRPKWIMDCDAPTKKLLASADLTERAWAHAIWLALGHTDQVDQLLELVAESKSSADAESNSANAPPTLVQILSWLPPRQLAKTSKAHILESSSDANKLLAALRDSTRVDNEDLADWIFDFAAAAPLQGDKAQADLAQILLRARAGDHVEQRITAYYPADQYTYANTAPYRVTSTHEPITVPGYFQVCEWLRQKFMAATNDRQRAIALLAVAELDHKTAVDAALGAIERAKADSELLPAALAIAFSDRSQISANRAATMLGHPASQVRRAALVQLAEPVFRRQVDGLPPTRSAEEHDPLPGLSRATAALPKHHIEALAKSGDARQQAQAKLLLLAAGDKLELAELERLVQPIAESKTKLLVAAALAKAKRTDDAAVAYYRETYAALSREAGDTRLPALYDAIRALPGEELSGLRRQMRQEKGAQLFEQNRPPSPSYISL
jgi:thioredoxin 1